jgi:ComF family protein
VNIRQRLNQFLSIFLEAQCPLCDRPASGGIVCPYCDRQLQQAKVPNPKYLWQGDLPLFVWGAYGGILKRAIAQMKYDNQPQLGTWLGEQLGHSWRQHFPQQPLSIIPIPMHPSKQQERGFNQAELISRQFTQVIQAHHAPQVLVRRQATKALFDLNRQQRQQELANAFVLDAQAKRGLGDRPVLLIDDIYTSGSTAQAAYRTLQQGGVTVLGIAAIATPKPTAQSPHRPNP